MVVARVQPLRVVVRSPLLVRLGSALLVAAVLLATVFQMDPADLSWGADVVTPLKYAPVALTLLSGASLLLGVRGVPLGDRFLLSALALGAFMLSGSLYSVLGRGVVTGETFLGRGLGVFALVPAFILAHLPRQLDRTESYLRPAVTLAVLVMSVVIVLHRTGLAFADLIHVYHEESVMLALVAGGCMTMRGTMRRMASVAVVAIASSLTVKWTGFGFAAISMGMLALLESSARAASDVSGLVRRRLLIFQTVIGGGVLTAIAIVALRSLLPTGSADVRMQTYTQRWKDFRASPVFGDFFSGSPIVEAGWLQIPSHSDTLDILAMGGLVAGLLFLVPVYRVLRDCLPGFGEMTRSGSAMLPAAMVFVPAFLFEMTFNPVLHQPKLSIFFWLSMGVLLAERRRRAWRTAATTTRSTQRMEAAAPRPRAWGSVPSPGDGRSIASAGAPREA